MRTAPRDQKASDALELMVDNDRNDALPDDEPAESDLVGLDAIRRELEREIALLEPLHSDPSPGLLSSNGLPSNEQCGHKGKVFSVGIMKTGTTSMNAALSALGYKCHGDSCIHVGNWDFLKDAIHLWFVLRSQCQ